MSISRKICVMLLAAVLAAGCLAFPAAADETVELQIIATSDVHGMFASYDYALNAPVTSGSYCQIATAINAIRTENTILLDGGDLIQGNSSELFLNFELHPMAVALNEMGYDAWVTGNHEYNFGLATLRKFIAGVNAPVLCANVLDENGDPLGAPYIILERSGVKVAVIGTVSSNITRWDAPILKDCTVSNPVTATRAALDALQGKADVFIALTHMMVENELDTPDTGARDLANACPELDLIISAHGHNLVDDLVINGVPIVENKNAGQTFARILIGVTKDGTSWQVTYVTANVETAESYAPDTALTEKLKPYHERAVLDAESVIGRLDAECMVPADEIPGLPTVHIEDTALMDLVNEVQLYYTGAKVSATAPLTDTVNLYRGDIRKCDMAFIYKYSNTLYTLEMTGAQLKTWMEWSAGFYNTYQPGDLTLSFNADMRGYLHDVFSGVCYEVNVSKEPGSRIENLRWPDGTPVQPDETFTATTNSHRATSLLLCSGSVFAEGEPLPKLLGADVHSELGGIREMIGIYIQNVKHGVIDADVDGNWHITGIGWDLDLHKKAAELVREGKLALTFSADGRASVCRPITEEDVKPYISVP